MVWLASKYLKKPSLGIKNERDDQYEFEKLTLYGCH